MTDKPDIIGIVKELQGRLGNWRVSRMDVVQGHYPGLYEIEGLSFLPKFWTVANDISLEEANYRANEADDLCAMRNHFPAIAAALLERDEALKIAVEALEKSDAALRSVQPQVRGLMCVQDVQWAIESNENALARIRSLPSSL